MCLTLYRHVSVIDWLTDWLCLYHWYIPCDYAFWLQIHDFLPKPTEIANTHPHLVDWKCDRPVIYQLFLRQNCWLCTCLGYNKDRVKRRHNFTDLRLQIDTVGTSRPSTICTNKFVPAHEPTDNENAHATITKNRKRLNIFVAWVFVAGLLSHSPP